MYFVQYFYQTILGLLPYDLTFQTPERMILITTFRLHKGFIETLYLLFSP